MVHQLDREETVNKYEEPSTIKITNDLEIRITHFAEEGEKHCTQRCRTSAPRIRDHKSFNTFFWLTAP